jgi:hypothetical protein
MKSRLSPFIFGGLLIAAIYAAPAQAQTRTWVSGTGDDSFPCSRTAPCKTFAGAIAKTAAGGEISVMDAGGYGAVTINKAITINGEGTLASVISGAGNGITVSAGASDQVILRNISLNGVGGGTNAILITGGNVTIEKCFIYGFTTGFIGGTGILIDPSVNVNVDVRDTNITNTSHGVMATTNGGTATVSLDNMRINNTPGYGVAAVAGGVIISLRNSFIRSAGTAISTQGGAATISVDHSELTNNTTAVSAAGPGSTVRLNDNSIYDSPTGLAISNGATINSGNNNKAGNLGVNAPPSGILANF